MIQVECSVKKNQLTGKNRVVYFFCESFHIGQDVQLKVSRTQVDNRLSTNFKDRFKTEELVKVIEATIKFKEYVFTEENTTPEEAVKKREVGLAKLVRRVHHTEQENSSSRYILFTEHKKPRPRQLCAIA